VIPRAAHAYRPDIDGLRALAVLAVLGYHAFPGVVPGGFVGVDVFFVISGFLITGIILEEQRRGAFSFAGFYWRRIRRIFPALILVLAACLALGWRVLLPDEFAQLGRHVAAGAGFVSNLALWRESGYFDSAAELKPLLHLWSLGIEEQYYLVWPLALFLLRRHPRRVLAMVLIVGALSFVLNVALVERHPSTAFYLPVTRFWELLGGSVLACLGFGLPARLREVGSFAGLALIAAALVLLNGASAFPGIWALAPVGGAMLIIGAGPSAWLNRVVFGNRLAVYIGLISYPLYLWHWPLLAYSRIVHGVEPPASLRAALLVLALVLSVLTYELIEKKIRRARLGALAKRAVPALGGSMAALACGGVLVTIGELPAQSAANPQLAEIARASADWQDSRTARIPGDSERAVLFFGDSHMEHYLPRIKRVIEEHRAPLRTVIVKTEGGCAPFPGIERKHERCSRFVDEGLKIAHEPAVDTVVIAASWVGFLNRGDYYKMGQEEGSPLQPLSPAASWVFERFERELATLVAEGKRVVLVLSSPRGSDFSPKSAIERDWTEVRVSHPFAAVPKSALWKIIRPIDERLKAIAARAGASVLDPTAWLCGPAACPAADEQGRPLYMDDSHIRASVARARITALDRYVYLERPQSAAAAPALP
jgi:peptidoglycan/LPS O-acetylase OafA/YrhL